MRRLRAGRAWSASSTARANGTRSAAREVLSRVGELAPPQVARALVDCLRAVAPDCGLQPLRRARRPAAAGVPIRPPTFCSGCPHNRSTRVPGRLARAGRHRLPHDRDVPEPGADRDRLAHGRRRRDVARAAAVHHGEARVRQHGRRHVLPLGLPRDPAGGGGQGADHLQAAGQRLRVDDRRAAASTASYAGAHGRASSRPRACARSRWSPTTRSASARSGCRPACRSTTAPSSTRCRRACASIPASRCSSTTSRARPSGGACASAASGPTPTGARSSTPPYARAAAIAARRRTACRSSRSRPRSAASAGSTRRRATRTSAASKGSARASSPCTAAGCARPRAPAAVGASAADLPPLPEPRDRAARRGLQHPGHRHRRHRRRDHRPDRRHGGAPGRPRRVDPRRDGARAEVRRGDVARAAGAPMPSALHATRIAAGEADAIIGCDLIVTAGDEALSRARSGRTRVALSHRPHARPAISRAIRTGRPTRARSLRRIEERCGAAAVDTIESIRIASVAAGRPDRGQHVHAGPRLAARLGAGVAGGDRARDRAERRAGGVQQDVLPVGPARRARSRGGREARRRPTANVVSFSPRETVERIVAARVEFLTAYRDAAYAQRYRALVARVIAAERAAGMRRPVLARRGALPLQAAGGEGRMGSGAPLCVGGLPARAGGDLRGRLHAALPSGRVAVRPHRPGLGPAGEGRGGPVGADAPSAGWRACAACAARGSTRSATRRSGSSIAGCSPATRPTSSACSPASTRPGYERAVAIASLPDRIRGYGHVRAAAAEAVAKEREDLLRGAMPAARAA